MRAGLPVIATRVGGMAEVVQDGETGTLVSDADEEAMAEAMMQFMVSPARRRQMGERGHAYMHCEFSVRTSAAKYLALYAA